MTRRHSPQIRRNPKRPTAGKVGLAAVYMLSTATMALAEGAPSLNFYGATGLMDMPSGEAQPDGQISFSSSHFGPISRNTLSFQITPRLSGSFRFSATRDWNDRLACAPACTGVDGYSTYYDRSFDLRYQIFEESRYVPAVTIGLQDLAGTGIYSGEYVAATKHLTPTLKVTGGIGWGRLGSHSSFGSPFGDRDPIDIGRGGKVNFGQWFRGPAAPFAGLEWQFDDAWTLKAEYSSDAYAEEVDYRATFDRKSSFNFGVEYQPNEQFRVGAYYMYGSEFGIAGHLMLDPKRSRPINEPAPKPIRPRPPRTDLAAWSGNWVAQSDAGEILRQNIETRLEQDGIRIEAMGYSADRVQIRIRNTRLTTDAQAIGRTARVLSRTMPASVERFEIVPMANGVPTAAITIRRSDLEQLEFDPDATAKLKERIIVGEAGPLPSPMVGDDGLYPKFTWALTPYLRPSLFDPDSPMRADAGLRLSGSYDLAPGWVLSGAITQKIVGNLDKYDRISNSRLAHVRTDGYLYNRNDGPVLDSLTLAWYGKLGDNIYSRISGGYLEQMFGGVSGEVLWKPADSRLALGVEVNYARQRDFNQRFGFQDYDVVTGHVSAYYEFNHGFTGQLDVGRYLAGDVGATLSLEREFANGWRVGAFATKTDVSSEEFGEGSFDKGIRLTIPLGWLTGSQSRTTYSTTLRPITRDGGARLHVGGRLYETIRDGQKPNLDAQFGRFWK
ncbi:MAG: YjbH domain-containing protein [Pseudorhodobacter sp.]